MTNDCVSEDVELNRLLLDQLADKWTILVLQVFCGGPEPVRFNEIKRRVQGVSQKTLTRCLRGLERNGILERRVVEAAPLGVEYSITPLGWTIAEPFGALQRWAEKYLPDVLEAQARFDRRVQNQGLSNNPKQLDKDVVSTQVAGASLDSGARSLAK
jgi:DNA-binding HxlR family transcriptional regulator